MIDDAPSFKQVKKINLVSEVYNALMEAIVDGRLKPGQKVVETVIAREMNISRAPVREAARLLERKGLLVSEQNLGFFVKTFDKKQVDDIYELRLILQVAATQFATANITDKNIASLKSILSDMKSEVEAGDISKFVSKIIEFQLKICSYSNNARLTTLFKEITDEIQLIINWVGIVYSDPVRVLERFETVMTAIEERNSAWAASAIEGHIRRSWVETQTFLKNKSEGESRTSNTANNETT